MKISCKIIEDLLPLYNDDICSADSKALIEEHLSTCENCKNILQEMRCIPQINNNTKLKPLKGISEQWKKSNKRNLIKGLLISLCCCLSLVLLILGLTQLNYMPVPTHKMSISDIYELSDGQIGFHLYIDDNLDLNAITTDITEDGVMYITPKRSVIENKRMEFFNKGLFNRDYVVCTRGEIQGYTDFNYVDRPLKAVYLGTKNDSILIWDTNTTLTKADKTIETRYTDDII